MIKHMKPSNKFTPSPSSSSNYYKFTCNNTKNGLTSGCCFRRILRRIFCMSRLSSCPSHHHHHHHHHHHIKEEEEDPLLPDASTAPGVVARLMGLESLPDIDTNSIRRRRKSIPTYTEIQDDKFVILSFDQLSMEDSMKVNLNSAEKKQIVRAKCKKKRIQEWNKENSEEDSNSDRNITDFHVRNSGYVLKNLCQNSHLDMKKKAKQERLAVVKFGIEDDSENSSPNSVLDVLEFSPGAHSGDSISRLGKSSKLRRTLSEELENYRKTADKKRLIKSGRHKEEEEEENHRSRVRNRNKKSANNEIGILAARETVKSNWLEDKTQHHHYKDISRDLASEIFHQLLGELLINIL
ncbi:hypothetical protein ACJIZ3_012468 [Penstemon smallii]|uniref:DUF3741 domain-containing protein n=1 Tax=Penstemon smallii TaxID=265156 RepID=A0ABD3UNP4_9LAMI